MQKPNTNNENTNARKFVLMLSVGLMLALLMVLKTGHYKIPMLNVDAGGFLIGILIVGGFIFALVYGSVSSNTQTLVAQGKYRLAEKGLRKGLRLHRFFGPMSIDYVRDLVLLTRVCRETEQFADAEGFAKQALDVLDRNDEEWNRLRKEQKISPESEQLYKLSAEFNKSFEAMRPEALYELGATQFELKKYREAEQSLDRAIKLFANYVQELSTPESKGAADESWLTKDFVLASVKDENRRNVGPRIVLALRAASKCARLLARTYEKQGRAEDGEFALSKAKSLDKKNIEFLSQRIAAKADDLGDYINRAGCYVDLGRYSEALADLNHALSAAKEQAMRYVLLTNRGECWNRMGKLNEALTDFDEAAKLNPSSGLVLMNRAEVHERLGKRDLAEKDRKSAGLLGYSPPRLEWVDLSHER